MAETKSEHFVYVYRNRNGKIFYVGKGKSATRTITSNRSHNPSLDKELKKDEYSIEISGPYGDDTIASAVETALIDCVPGIYNIANGPGEFRFRPLGIPQSFAKRLDESRITKKRRSEIEKDGVIYTYVNMAIETVDSRKFEANGRQSDKEILIRFDRFWFLKSNAKKWSSSPELSPKWLIGIAGTKNRRWIIGCVEIDKNGWKTAYDESKNHPYGKIRVPLLSESHLDAHPEKIRGLIFKPEAAPTFTQQGHIVVLRTNSARSRPIRSA